MILELTVECLTHRQLDILTQDISLAHTRPLAALYRLKLVRSIWRDAIGSRYGSALEVARRISHLGPQHVHDQQFTGRDASRRLRELALLCRFLGGARSSCMGGRLVGNGRRTRRPDRAVNRSGCGRDLVAPDCDANPSGGFVLLCLSRATPTSCDRQPPTSLDSVFLPRA